MQNDRLQCWTGPPFKQHPVDIRNIYSRVPGRQIANYTLSQQICEGISSSQDPLLHFTTLVISDL